MNRSAVLLICALLGCPPVPPRPPGRVIPPPGSQSLSGYATVASLKARAIGAMEATAKVHLAISLKGPDDQGLRKLAGEVADPASPSYRKLLTPDEIVARFGPPAADYQALVDWAKAHKLQVDTWPSRLIVDVTGTVADVEQALHVALVEAARPDGSKFYAPDRQPSLDLGPRVLRVSGLDNFVLPEPRGGSGPNGWYASADVRLSYTGNSPLKGTGQQVGIMAFDGFTTSDIDAYQTQLGIAPHVPTQKLLYGTASGAPAGTNVETAADVELAIAMAPGLTKVVVFIAPACSYINTILTAMQGMPAVHQFSNSFGCGWDSTSINLLHMMGLAGQSFFVVAGDFGGFPANFQYSQGGDAEVTIVGGTTLTMSGNGAAYQSEVPWVNSGGGSEYQITQPSWQSTAGINWAGNGGSSQYRNDPDVSIVGQNLFVVGTSPNPGGWFSFTGTSASAPLWAGYMALVNQRNQASGLPPLGFANPTIYKIGASTAYANSFHDVSSGSTTSLAGGPNHAAVNGFDLASGWGTPKGALLEQLSCIACSGATASVGVPPACVAFMSDKNNCGGCGQSCGIHSCLNGQCLTCFVAGTPVDTERGLRPIETIARGDRVRSFDTATGETVLREVVALQHRVANSVIPVTLEGAREPILVSPEHYFWVRGSGWVRAQELRRADRLLTPGGELRGVRAVGARSAPAGGVDVYNLVVAEHDDYFVGTAKVLVHSCDYLGFSPLGPGAIPREVKP